MPRLLVASTVAGMVYLQLMLPCVPQLIDYFKTERALGELGLRWHRNMGAHLLAGIPWNNSDIPSAGYQELQWTAEAHPHIFLFLRAAAVTLLILGVLRLGLARPAGWIVLAALLLPGPLVYLVSRAGNHYLYEWYLFFGLSGLVGFVALGVDWLRDLLVRRHRFAAPLVGGLAVLAFFVATQPAASLAGHPFTPADERGRPAHSTGSLTPTTLVRSLLLPSRSPGSHGRTTRISSSSPAFDQLVQNLQEADRSAKTLYINFANAWTAAASTPKLYAMVEDDRLFEEHPDSGL